LIRISALHCYERKHAPFEPEVESALAARLNVLAVAAGILAPILYALTVILGAALTPGYSHVTNAISELIAAGAAAKPLLDPLFALYNLLIVTFAFGLRQAFRRRGVDLSLLSPLFLGLVGTFGLLMWPFPQDPVGEAATVGGIVHLVLAAGQSVGTMLAILFMAVSLRRYPVWHRFSAYCLVTLAAIFLSGIAAALAAASLSPSFGLVERVTIGLFLQWVLVVAVTLALSGGKVGASARV
jgi:hypothetical membrane protein